MTRIAMWSGPRNLSTAMLRSWEHRADTEVLDEPLYAAYLASTGLDHPGRDEIIATGPADFDTAIARCLDAPVDRPISYQKHMAHHLLAGVDRRWLDELRHGLLLRDPRRVLASYTKVRGDVTLDDLGIPQQVELAQRCEVIVDADDFLTDPTAYQREICRRFGVEFDAAMLRWPAGRRDTDGVWAPHWYGAVEASTGFGPAPTSGPPVVDERVAHVAEEALELYRGLHRRRLVI